MRCTTLDLPEVRPLARRKVEEAGVEDRVDDEWRSNAFGLMMPRNMLIGTRGRSDFAGADFDAWARKAGFRETRIMPLAGPTSASLPYK